MDEHPSGALLADRGDGLHWLRCTACRCEWAERDDGSFAAGTRKCSLSDAARREGMIAGLERALDLIVDRPLSCEPIRAEIERIRRGE